MRTGRGHVLPHRGRMAGKTSPRRRLVRYGPAYGRRKIRVRHGATVQVDATGIGRVTLPDNRNIDVLPTGLFARPRFSSSRLRRQLFGEGFAGIPLDYDGKTHRERLLKPIADETETLASRIFAGRIGLSAETGRMPTISFPCLFLCVRKIEPFRHEERRMGHAGKGFLSCDRFMPPIADYLPFGNPAFRMWPPGPSCSRRDSNPD